MKHWALQILTSALLVVVVTGQAQYYDPPFYNPGPSYNLPISPVYEPIPNYDLNSYDPPLYGPPGPYDSHPPVPKCQEGQVIQVDGSCHFPKIIRQLYVYAAPDQPEIPVPKPKLPAPMIYHNILFIRAPKPQKHLDPVVIPPPRQENIVYVLNKKIKHGQKVIQSPFQPSNDPEVYFIDYEHGDDAILPGGVDLKTALSSAIVYGGGVNKVGGVAGDGGIIGEVDKEFGGVDGITKFGSDYEGGDVDKKLGGVVGVVDDKVDGVHGGVVGVSDGGYDGVGVFGVGGEGPGLADIVTAVGGSFGGGIEDIGGAYDGEDIGGKGNSLFLNGGLGIASGGSSHL